MANVTFTSRQAYYDHVRSGRATTQRERIMRYMLDVGRPVTRHEIVDRFFCVHPGPRALDGGAPIPWQSAGGCIAPMVCREGRCDHSTCKKYLTVVHEGKCPVTGNLSEFLAPIETNWSQRRLF